jgi:hypothetical protein
MPKSYKITLADIFDTKAFGERPLKFDRQLQIEGTSPGPQTEIRSGLGSLSFRDFKPYEIEHERDVFMFGRLYDDNRAFSKFIARSEIRAYHSEASQILLLCGKKADILDFCRKTEEFPQISLQTIEIDMKALQEKLPEVSGAWFRYRAGFIRAKGFMGQQIQDTAEYKNAANEGDISTLSFYFEDSRNGGIHPIQVTEDGAVVLQKNYKTVEDELDFVLHVKATLLDGIYRTVKPSRQKRTTSDLPLN